MHTESLEATSRISLLNQLSRLLPTLQQDPTPVTDLIHRLLAPNTFTFSDVLSIQPRVDFHAGLRSPSPPVNLVTLRLLEKAKYRLSDIGIIAGQQDLVSALIQGWLFTQETAVAQKAGEVLSDLLLSGGTGASSSHVDPLHDENLMWRRVFRDKNIYESIFAGCSLATVGQDGQPSLRQKTVAQGRLLDLLLVVRDDPVRTSQIPEIEKRYGVRDGGLLEFATVHMVDYEDDDLMLSILLNFCINFIRTGSGRSGSNSSALDFLTKHHLHKSCLSYYLEKPPRHASWVQGDSAHYLAVYSSSYRQDLLSDPALPDQILDILCNRLSNIGPGSWLAGHVPINDLTVLRHLPQIMLFPHGSKSPLTMVPPRSSNPNVLETLSTVFSSPAGTTHEDEAAARALYFLYLDEYPDFWSSVIKAADTVAVLDVALAANRLIGSIITASWQPLSTVPPSARYSLPTEEWLSSRYNYAQPLPQTGIEAVISTGSANQVLPYIMKPAQTFSNAVGGGRGDVESAAWKVAVAKHDVLKHFHEKIKHMERSPDVQAMITAVEQRITQGPMGGMSQAGGRIGTMEQ